MDVSSDFQYTPLKLKNPKKHRMSFEILIKITDFEKISMELWYFLSKILNNCESWLKDSFDLGTSKTDNLRNTQRSDIFTNSCCCGMQPNVYQITSSKFLESIQCHTFCCDIGESVKTSDTYILCWTPRTVNVKFNFFKNSRIWRVRKDSLIFQTDNFQSQI